MTYLTELPDPPSTLDPANFDVRADAFVFALTQFVEELNAAGVDINLKVGEVTFPRYIGPFSTDPTLKPNGQPLELGQLYLNTTNFTVRVFTSSGWTAVATPTPVAFSRNLFSGNGTLNSFQLSPLPYSSTAAFVFVGGQIRNLGIDYNIDANGVLSFTTPPASGTNNIVVQIFSPVNYGVPDDNSITTPKLRNLAVTTEKFASNAKAPLAGTADTVVNNAITEPKLASNSVSLPKLARAGANRQVLSSNGPSVDPAYRTLREVCKAGALGQFGNCDTVYAPMTVLDIDGYPIVWGNTDYWNPCNQYAAGHQTARRAILNVPLPANVMFVKSVNTPTNSYLLASNGWVYACGFNNFGQLGLGDTLRRDIYTRIEFFVNNNLSIVDVVAAGSRPSFSSVTSVYFRTSTGRAYACGYNNAGHLGIGNTTQTISTPTLISPNLADVVDIVVTSNDQMSTYIRTANGNLFATGYNGQGQLGIGNTTNQTTFVQTALTNVTEVSATFGYVDSNFTGLSGHALARTSNGTIHAAGFNGFGQLGLGDTTNRNSFQPITTPVPITNLQACGGYYGLSLGIGTNGALYTWGYNGQGAIGDGTLTNRTSPYQVIGYTSLTTNFPASAPPFNTKIAKVVGSRSAVAGHNRVLVLSTDGEIYYAGHDYAFLTGPAQRNLTRFTQAYVPSFYEPGERIIDVVEHGFDGQNLRYFCLSNLGSVYAVGNNEAGVCSSSLQAQTPSFVKSFNRIDLG